MMKFTRRQFLRVAAGIAALPAVSGMGWAQTYPTRPVRLIVGFAPGGPNDIVARLIGQWLSERLGQQFIIENRTGAGGNIGTEAVVNASPDGYTLLLIDSSNTINPTLYDKLNFNFLRDITPVAGIMRGPLVMEVNSAFPAKTVLEFIAHAKANPGKISMGSGGIGTSSHLAGELFRATAGIDTVHVPYRGTAPALADLLGAQVQVMFGNMLSSIAYIRDGRLRALAVTTTAPSEALPGIPTVGDFVSGYEASAWQGVGAPKNTPGEIIEKLNGEINASLADPRMRARLADLGGTAFGSTAREFGNLIAQDTDKWGKVIRAANIRAE
jgi:tripartite-type tricarboxylate transporter receptor subunit TctC